MTVVVEIVRALKELGGQGHLSEIYKLIPQYNDPSIRACLQLYCKESRHFNGKDLFYSVHGFSAKKGVWALVNADIDTAQVQLEIEEIDNYYKELIQAYLEENVKSSIDELYKYVSAFKETGKTGKRYLREVVSNRYKGSDIFGYDGKYAWLKDKENEHNDVYSWLKNNKPSHSYASLKATKNSIKNDSIEENREGELSERKILARKRNRIIVRLAKERDNYTCLACGFSFYNRIVEAHHLTPLSESGDTVVNIDNLITLCPNCHSIAHYLLKFKSEYTQPLSLIGALQDFYKNNLTANII